MGSTVEGLPQQLQTCHHTYSCLMKACIAFNSGIFYIFSGPLFANVEGYVYLDLIVWGLSPLAFMLVRPWLAQQMRQGGHHKTLRAFMVMYLGVFLSYLFLNYSASFNWNYFPRTLNLALGYFMFGMIIRSYELLIDLEQLGTEQALCQTHCEIQHGGLTFSYAVVFYLASYFDVSERNNGPIIFATSCFFSGVSVLLLPLIYYLKHRQHPHEPVYTPLNQSEPETRLQALTQPSQASNQLQSTPSKQTAINNIQLGVDEQIGVPEPTSPAEFTVSQFNMSTIGFFLIESSLILNSNYFSLWLMETLSPNAEPSYFRYNITIQRVSTFLLLSSAGNYLMSRVFVRFPSAKNISKLFLGGYGVLIAVSYANYSENWISMIVLGFGVHQASSGELAHRLNIDPSFYVWIEIAMYFVLPLICTVLKIGVASLEVYSLLSGVFLVFGAALV